MQIYIIDNGSMDDSIEYIVGWCDGSQESDYAECWKCLDLDYGNIEKPISYIMLDQYELHSTVDDFLDNFKIVIIKNTNNLGYAGGNNVILKHILQYDRFTYIWLLNNDTIVHSKALEELLMYMDMHKDVGICGSKIYYYNIPSRIQACGGAFYNKWLGVISNCDNDILAFKHKLSYIVGASMMITGDCLRSIGFLSEEYFLYFEELDWANRDELKYSFG